MLISKLLRAKKTIVNKFGETIIDLISATYKFNETPTSAGVGIVNEEEVMRPDLIANRFYANQENWEAILKFNGISNPFSIDIGETLILPPFTSVDSMITPPREVVEKGTDPTKKNEDVLLTPKTKKDKQRLESLRVKAAEIVPPNVNLTGVKNIEVINGEVVFGGGMTQAVPNNPNQATTRSRIQAQLNNNNNNNLI
jgi:hypothetical protein